MKKVLLDFFSYPVATKVAFYRNVINKITGNPGFATPDVSLDEARAVVDKLETAMLAAKDGGRIAVSTLQDCEMNADLVFRTLAAYINRMAQGDETKILSSGFHFSQPHGSISKPEIAAQDGQHSGCVKLVAKAVTGAGAYIWQMAKGSLPADEAGWLVASHSTTATIELTGLAIATTYYFRVAAITASGVSDYTAPVMKIVV